MTKTKTNNIMAEEETRVCNKCNEEQDIMEFTYGKKVRVVKQCRKCRNANCRKYKKTHKDEIKDYNKQYKRENKEDIDKYNAQYFSENKKTIYERHNAYIQEYRKTNPQFAIGEKLRGIVRKIICRESKKYELIGCSRKFLVEWFKFLFEDDMNMENHGDVWHVDHVIPCKIFDLEDDDESERCFHWSNLQPLHRDNNYKKGDRISKQEVRKHIKLVEEFIDDYEGDEEYTTLDYDRSKYVK